MAAIGEAVALAPVTRGQTTSRSRLRAALILIGPATALLLAIFVYPFLYALYISFTEWTLGQQLNPVWSGLANYASLAQDGRFLNSLSRSALFVSGAVGVEMILGFALALLFNQYLPGFGFLRTIAVLPVMVMPVATGLVWFYMLNFKYGPLNVLLRFVHFPVQNWLPDPNWSMAALILADVWQWTPFVMIVLIAGLRSLPEYVYEAAAIDGLRPVETFFKVTLPLLSLRFNHDRLPSCRMSGWFCDAVNGVTAQAAFLKAGKRGARPDRAPFGRPGERPQGFGAFAGVSSVTKSCGNA